MSLEVHVQMRDVCTFWKISYKILPWTNWTCTAVVWLLAYLLSKINDPSVWKVSIYRKTLMCVEISQSSRQATTSNSALRVA